MLNFQAITTVTIKELKEEEGRHSAEISIRSADLFTHLKIQKSREEFLLKYIGATTMGVALAIKELSEVDGRSVDELMFLFTSKITEAIEMMDEAQNNTPPSPSNN